ncbi:MAG: hypothetical protein LR015_07185 [Verrucomicrobia bacterium]|nr:hypothetical protein [Verrucomicrobiota bacterium]
MPSALEFLDRQSVVCTERMWQRSVFPGHAGGALLLVELDGPEDAVRLQSVRLTELMQAHAQAILHATSAEKIEELWRVRRNCSQAMFQLGDSKLNEDVVVPLRSQQQLLAATLELKERTGLATPTFGHAADGNFHVHIMYNRDDPEHKAKAREGIQWLMQTVVDLGGAITGEHGVGLAKSPFIALQHNPAELRAMRAIKQALDPRSILNPGKIWDPVEVWDHPVERGVVLPWDHRK